MAQVANLITSAHINTNGAWSAAGGASTGIHSTASSTEYVYTLVNPNWSFDTGTHRFKYCNDSTSSDYQKWMDVGTDNPVYIVDGLTFASTTSTNANPEIVSFWYNSSGLLFAINNPYYQSSGGGTSTEELLVPSGSITKDASNALYFTVNKSSPLTSSVNVYGIYKDFQLIRSINHSSSAVDAVDYENNAADGVWSLWHDDGANLQQLASYTVGFKKVFCNFW